MSTSKLQRYTGRRLHRQFGKYGLVENVYPAWLVSSKGERLELDFFIGKLSTAVEVQGKQHLEFIPFFHATEYDFSEQLRRDTEKKDLCDKAGVYLLYVYDKLDVETTLYEIHARVQKQLDTQEDAWFDDDDYKCGSGGLRAIFEITRTPLQQRLYEVQQRLYEEKLERKLSRFTPAEQQAYFDKAVYRLKCSLNEAASIIAPKKARRKLRLLDFYINRNYVTISNEQGDTIMRARKRGGE